MNVPTPIKPIIMLKRFLRILSSNLIRKSFSENRVILALVVLPQYIIVTDRQTDRRYIRLVGIAELCNSITTYSYKLKPVTDA